MGSYQASLFDAPREAVISTGSDWMTGLIGGSLAVSLCVIAMGILGMLILTGRLHLRRGAQVVLGCFLLLGSAMLARGMVGLGEGGDAAGAETVLPPPQPSATPLPPATEDRYSGASLRQE